MNKRVFLWAAGALLAGSAMVCAQAGAQPPAPKPSTPASTPAPQMAAPTTSALSNSAPGASSTASGASRVATVHIQFAIANCAEGKKATDDLQKRFAPKKDELERKTKEIQDLQQKLQQGEKVLNDDQRNQLMRDIDRKTKDFNRDNDDATADYQQAVDGLFNAIGSKLMQVLQVYAQKNGFDLVLNSDQQLAVLYQNDHVDITAEIVGAYNMTFPASGLATPPTTPSGTRPTTTPSAPATKKPQPQ